MVGKYTLRVVTDFSAAHILHGYNGPCSRLHGHNWTIEVEVEAWKLDNIGMGIDFREIKQHTKALVETVDHQFLNELPAFTGINPTAEHIAAWFYHELAKDLNQHHTRLTSVTIWENDRCSVKYTNSEFAAGSLQ